MNDAISITYVIVYGSVMCAIMKKHGTWKPLKDFGDVIAWFMVALLLFGLTRWLVLGLMDGFAFPQTSKTLSFHVSSIITILLWAALMYWRIPHKLFKQ